MQIARNELAPNGEREGRRGGGVNVMLKERQR